MPQIRLIPSTYEVSSTNLSVSSASNMYTNTDSTTYATVTNNQNGTTSYYIYIRGFNFNDVPSNVIVNSITIKLKASHSGGNTGTIYGYNGTSEVSAAGTTTALGTSATVKTFTNTTIAWDTLKGYGNNFGIRINCKRNNKKTRATFNIYGAEILVDYTIPVYHSVSFNNTSSVSISPSTTQSVIEGNDLTIQINTSNKNAIRVSDNNVDVSSQVVQGTGSCTYTISNVQADHTISVTDAPSYNVSITNNSGTVTTQPSSTQTIFEGDSQSITFYNISSLDDVAITDNSNDIESQLVHSTSSTKNLSFIPDTLVDSNSTVTNPNNGLTDHTSTTYAEVAGNNTYYMMYKFDTSSIPENATINSISCTVKAQHTRSTAIGQAQLYTGSTAKGSAYTFGNTTTAFELTTGTWTRSELNDIKLRIGSNYTGTSTYYTRFYGATLTVNYTVQEDIYTYTISNISADHAIVIADTVERLYIKVNEQFLRCKKIFRKVNNVWTEVALNSLTAHEVYIYMGSMFDQLGYVDKSLNDLTINISDGALASGTYTLVYEDESDLPITNVDKITTITIS